MARPPCQDLDALTDTEIHHEGKHFLLRSEAQRTAGKVCKTLGIALPRTVRVIEGGN